MKNSTVKYFIAASTIAFLMACSTKKDKFLNRNFQAINTEFNVLYNGNLALEEGLKEVRATYADNYWETLPVERMQFEEAEMFAEEERNANFLRAEDKAIKAIQKRSMLIGGKERNPQIDEAHLLLGKARYFDQRYIPALEAFNYILYKYPTSDKIAEAKIWREKTNIRLEQEELALTNLKKLLTEIKFKDQTFADANASMAQAFINLQQIDSAISKLTLATKYTKDKEQKARYRFIMGQLLERNQQKDSAFHYYQQVIDMNRQSPRVYTIHAHARQAKMYEFQKEDTLLFLKKWDHLLVDRENRPYLDVLHHYKGLFHEQYNQKENAIKEYKQSLKKRSNDDYMIASNYRNLAEIYFDQAQYSIAGKFLDSTLQSLEPRTREYYAIRKKRLNLDDVILYEGIAKRHDSILNISNLSEEDKVAFYLAHIETLKEADLKQLKEEEKRAKQESSVSNTGTSTPMMTSSGMMPPSGDDVSNFYFYNSATVAFGKREFEKVWGKRTAGTYWRLSGTQPRLGFEGSTDIETEVAEVSEDTSKTKQGLNLEDPRYNPMTYIDQLPTDKKYLDSLQSDRNFAYYQLGIIYKEKFKEYALSADRFEILLQSQPQERLVLPAMYHLYKVYEIIDPGKAEKMRGQIVQEYPESRYAQILTKGTTDGLLDDDPVKVYASLYKELENGHLREVHLAVQEAIERFVGDEMLPKFESLKAVVAGRLSGLEEYKNGLNFVALNYPNVEEGKFAEAFVTHIMPRLENLDFGQEPPITYKIVYKADDVSDKKIITLMDKVKKFISERNMERLTTSVDIYTMDQNFFVIHGLTSEENAKGIAGLLRDLKEYTIDQPFTIISTEDYKVVQIKKTMHLYVDPNYIPQEKKEFPPVPDDLLGSPVPLPTSEKTTSPRDARREKAVQEMKQKEEQEKIKAESKANNRNQSTLQNQSLQGGNRPLSNPNRNSTRRP